jgi:hypothetical protein
MQLKMTMKVQTTGEQSTDWEQSAVAESALMLSMNLKKMMKKMTKKMMMMMMTRQTVVEQVQRWRTCANAVSPWVHASLHSDSEQPPPHVSPHPQEEQVQ